MLAGLCGPVPRRVSTPPGTHWQYPAIVVSRTTYASLFIYSVCVWGRNSVECDVSNDLTAGDQVTVESTGYPEFLPTGDEYLFRSFLLY